MSSSKNETSKIVKISFIVDQQKLEEDRPDIPHQNLDSSPRAIQSWYLNLIGFYLSYCREHYLQYSYDSLCFSYAFCSKISHHIK